jgi:hypothetical protein
MRRVTIGRALSIALIVIAMTAASAQADVPSSRYGFANGCFSLQDQSSQLIAPASGPFLMRATTLGEYLIYGVHQDFLADPGSGTPAPVASPSTAAEWELNGNLNAGYSLKNMSTNNVIPVTFLSNTGCAVFPEASTGAYGRNPRSMRSGSKVYGWADAHMHWTGFRLFGSQWHCGTPIHKYGIPYALPDCAQYDQGTNGQVRAFIDGRIGPQPYDTVGWPTFGYWPGPTRQAEEGTYYTSVERAWMGGLRVLVVLFVQNEALCDTMTFRDPSPPDFCNDMDSVRQQNQDLQDFQDYVDAQYRGPGKGWLRIVKTPAQARRVIASGKLAVVKGIELSRILNCGETLETDPEPSCTEASVDSGLDELKNMGITSFFPVHKFDNAFGGTKMDSGALGPIVNAGNYYKTHHFWNVSGCPGAGEDETQPTVPVGADVLQLIYDLGLLPIGTPLPVYGPPPHCNQRGLTAIGQYLINRMIDRHFVIEVDHMDELTADTTMDIVEARHYPGVVNSHGGWSSDPTIARMKAVGGAVGFNKNPDTGNGIGSDINGLSSQPGPGSTPISYPFRDRQLGTYFYPEQYGDRTFDFNTDGVATYGEWVDWIEQRRREGQQDRVDALFRSAEDYLRMWKAARDHSG